MRNCYYGVRAVLVTDVVAHVVQHDFRPFLHRGSGEEHQLVELLFRNLPELLVPESLAIEFA